MDPKLLDSFRDQVESDLTAHLAMNACFKKDPVELCLARDVISRTSHVFQYKVETEGRPVTSQKATGRCWIFASLNAIRIPFMKSLNLEEFEFSQSYLFFWDKIERCNYFLHKIVECFLKGETVDGRLISYMLHDPPADGGQWTMLVNLITRYGLMPKKCFQESYCSENSASMNNILKSKLREYAKDLCDLVQSKSSQTEIEELIERQMGEIFRIVAVCLSIPPKTFTWEYYDKSKEYKKIENKTPLQFYKEYVEPVFDVKEKVCLVSDPRPSNPYGKIYTVDCLGNMHKGQIVLYNNQPIEVLMEVATKSIKDGEGVWVGCQIERRSSNKIGIDDIDVHDYKSVFGVEVNIGMDRASRLQYGDAKMTHAMILTGVTSDENDVPLKWRVENSWGEDYGEKGYCMFTSPWFKEFVFEVVIDKRYLTEEIMNAFREEVVVLPAWDPLGALAL